MRFCLSYILGFLMCAGLLCGCKTAEKTVSHRESFTRINHRLVPVFTPSDTVRFSTHISVDEHGFPRLSNPIIESGDDGTRVKLTIDSIGNIDAEVISPPKVQHVDVADTTTVTKESNEQTIVQKPSLWSRIKEHITISVITALVIGLGLLGGYLHKRI